MNTGMISYIIFYALLILVCFIGGLFGQKIRSIIRRRHQRISISHFDEVCGTDILLGYYRQRERFVNEVVKYAVDTSEKEPLSIIDVLSCMFVWLLPQIFTFDSVAMPEAKLDQYIVTQMEILIRKYAQQYDITDPKIAHGDMYVKRHDTFEVIRHNCYLLLVTVINPNNNAPVRLAISPAANWVAYNDGNFSALDVTKENISKLVRWIDKRGNHLISVRRATEDDSTLVKNDCTNNIPIQYVEEGSADGQ